MTEARDHLGRLWTANRYKIGEEPPTDYSHLSVSQRLAMVIELSQRAWVFVRAGQAAGVNRSGAAEVREGGWSADWSELLACLGRFEVRYLICGAHALGVHAEPRATRDLDLWLEPSPENATRIWAALREFGAPVGELKVVETDFAKAGAVVQLGAWLGRVDLFTDLVGVPDFAEAWDARVVAPFHGAEANVISREHYIASKRAAGRLKDLADLDRMGEKP